MKKSILSVLTLFSIAISAQNVNIPDASFKIFLVSDATINTNEDTEIQFSEANNFAGFIYIEPSTTVVSDFTGLEEFTSCTGLWIDGSGVSNTVIPLPLNNSLTSIRMENTPFTAFTNLESSPVLEDLHITNANLTTLNLNGLFNLEDIYIYQCTSLNNIDLTGCTNLIRFKATQAPLGNLNFNASTQLYDITINFGTAIGKLSAHNQDLQYFSIDNSHSDEIDLTNSTVVSPILQNSNLGILNLTNFAPDVGLTVRNCSADSVNLTDANGGAFKFETTVITKLDFSPSEIDVTFMTDNTQLTYLNLANGLNSTMSNSNIIIKDSPNLRCVKVDDETYSNNTWIYHIDTNITFSEDCDALVAGIKEESLNFNLFPNPSHNVLTISSDKTISIIEIFNSIGESVFSTSGNDINNSSINISSLAAGVYTVKIATGNEFGVKRLIKE